MEQQRYIEDKNKYGDEQEWTLTVNGLEVSCIAIRNDNECWCGYVYYQGRQFNVDDILVHGGITYHGPDTVGFDCNHYNDYCPRWPHSGTYRTFSYVKQEVKYMAEQIFR